MPTYDYVCNACGHRFELFQQMSDSVKRKCPKCGALKLERLIGTGAAVLFKGGGFYETDYRSESYKKAAEADKKAAEGTKPGKDAGCACGGNGPCAAGGDSAGKSTNGKTESKGKKSGGSGKKS
jgi:putative FmdB family regulatory protein